MSPPSQARIAEFMWILGDREGGARRSRQQRGKENAIAVEGGEQDRRVLDRKQRSAEQVFKVIKIQKKHRAIHASDYPDSKCGSSFPC